MKPPGIRKPIPRLAPVTAAEFQAALRADPIAAIASRQPPSWFTRLIRSWGARLIRYRFRSAPGVK